MNRDRGTIKWNAMMLPEHVKLLREWKAEDYYEEMPKIDEWAQQENAEQLQVANDTRAYTELTFWYNGEIRKERGYVQQLRQEQVLFEGRSILFSHLIQVLILE